MASSSTSSIQQTFKHDVFLSFRGEDTRKKFIDHLYLALTQKGIITYKDDETIKKGKKISDELIKSIEASKFYIIVFSKNYASSSWCLDELVKIMECQRMAEHTAFPIFYDVEPTEIRKQSGSVGVAFAKHERKDIAGKWRDALQEAASLAGWELKNTADGHEAKFIQKLVKEISLELRCTNLRFDGKLVGMVTRAKDVFSSLETHTDDIRMIGIKGMGGSGKTTLARAIYDQISMEFEGSSFVENVREVSNDSSKGLKSLQKQVLSEVLIDQEISVSGVFDGKHKLKRMLHCMKVLVVLDDVDHINQLEALAGEPNWFKPGSRVIITTRDEQVLVAHRLNFIRGKASCFIHDVNLLSDDEAITLFSKNAFGTKSPIQGYEELSEAVVHYAAGLPLTVSVLGSFLCDRSIFEWKDAIERLKEIPLEETLQKLELSYYGLENDYKEIFLDVACLLKGWWKDEAVIFLEKCGFHAEIGLKVLQQKSLVTVDSYGDLSMHDHIEEMGKNIVRRLHPKQPRKHSRLWIKEEIETILAKDLGTKATIGIYLVNSELHAATIMKGLRKMKALRFLHVGNYYSRHCDDDFNFEDTESYVLDCLRYLRWDRYPLTCLPKTFQVKNVAHFELSCSKIRQLLEGGERMALDNVTYIDLYGSTELRTLDLGPTPNLQQLILKQCYNLVELYMQVLDNVRYIDLSYSYKLRTLDLGPTPNLETLNLDCCHGLMELHMHGENPELKFIRLYSNNFLRIIHLGWSPQLKELSLEECKGLEELHMPVQLTKNLNLYFRDNLRTLDLSRTLNLENLHIVGCENLVELRMPEELKSLHLRYTMIRTLDLVQIQNLEEITIAWCNDLVELHIIAVKLRSFCLIGASLRTLDLSHIQNLKEIIIADCKCLVELIMPTESLKLTSLEITESSLRTLDLQRTSNLETLHLFGCADLVEVYMPVGSVKLKLLHLSFLSKLRTLDLWQTLNLEKLDISGCEYLVEMHMPAELKSLYLRYSMFRTINLAWIRNLEEVIIEGCMDLVELIMPVESPKLTSFKLTESSLRTLDLGRTSNLETLHLSSCVDLVEVYMPVGSVKIKSLHLSLLSKLRTLNVWQILNLGKLDIIGCEDLVELHMPAELKSLYLKASKLRTLDLAHIRNLEQIIIVDCMDLVELIMPVGSLRFLKLINYVLRTLDLTRNPNLETLYVDGYDKLVQFQLQALCSLRCLRELTLSGSFLEVPKDLHRLEFLEKLTLSSKEIKHLPNRICMLKHLKVLELESCYLLEQLPDDLGKLVCLDKLVLNGCKSLRGIPNSIKRLKGLCIYGRRQQLESFGFTLNEMLSGYYNVVCYI